MKTFFHRLGAALRLAGAVAAAGALFAAAPAQEKPKDAGIIYPRNAAPADAPAPAATKGAGSNFLLVVLAAGAAATGGWMLWRQRRSPGGLVGRDARKLTVAESRSLGNRQYLVVADYEGKKFLLGVCPGSIQLLAPLEADARPPRP